MCVALSREVLVIYFSSLGSKFGYLAILRVIIWPEELPGFVRGSFNWQLDPV